MTPFLLSAVAALSVVAAAQYPPLVRPFTELEELEVVAGRAFALDSDAAAPLGIVKIEEIHSPDGRSRFAYYVKNRSTADVRAWVVTATLVGTDGVIKARQPLKGSGLKPGQTRRQELTFRMAVPSISDAVAFAISEIQTGDGSAWTVLPAALDDIVMKAARARRR